MRRWISTFAILYLLCRTVALPAAEIRDADMIYLDEWKQPALHLKTLHRTPISSTRDPQNILGYLAPGQMVEVIALGETRHYVSARITTGATRGWVDAQALEAPSAELVATLQALREKTQAHRELIERHEVAVSMTRAEVRASLGKPEHTSRLRVEKDEQEQWFYSVYKYLPHYVQSHESNGQVQQVVSYRRELAAEKIVTFQNDEVVDIHEEQKETARQPTVIVASPARGIN